MTRFLITGFSGFVSRHFLHFLEEEQVHAEVLGVSRREPDYPLTGFRHVRASTRTFDLLDKAQTGDVLRRFRPDYILHLAALSSVGASWHEPIESFVNNTNIFLNVLEQVRVQGLRCRILSVGSSEEYGNVEPERLPLLEETLMNPLSPYAVARVSQEMLSRVYVNGYGLDIVMTRSFNHTGPFQRDAFVVPSLAKQLVAIARGAAPARIVTGDRSVIRDFVDVRDVVRAYHDLFRGGKSGEVYNVCRGEGHSIESVLTSLQRILNTNVVLETDPKLVRPNDNKVIVGSRAKIGRAVGWEPKITFEQSLRDIVAYWQSQA